MPTSRDWAGQVRRNPRFEDDTATREEVSDSDIHLSRMTGMAPADIDVLHDFTRERGLLMILRCPRRPAREFHGRFPAKPGWLKSTSDPSTGLVMGPHGAIYVSDYDLMSVWRLVGKNDWEKIFFSQFVPGVNSSYPPQAKYLMEDVNLRLKSNFQHGAQDDYLVAGNRGVRPEDQYMLFSAGMSTHVRSTAELKAFYDQAFGRDAWPYLIDGRHRVALE